MLFWNEHRPATGAMALELLRENLRTSCRVSTLITDGIFTSAGACHGTSTLFETSANLRCPEYSPGHAASGCRTPPRSCRSLREAFILDT